MFSGRIFWVCPHVIDAEEVKWHARKSERLSLILLKAWPKAPVEAGARPQAELEEITQGFRMTGGVNTRRAGWLQCRGS